MAIKNKDGTPYRLRGPNPAMRGQNLWGRYKLHNLPSSGRREVVEDVTPRSEVDVLPELMEEEPRAREVVVPRPEEPKPDHRPDVFHCLPAVIRRHKDALYGEGHATIQYEKPFTFEAVVTDTSDLMIQFWTNGLAGERIAEGSVIYPKTLEKRWWRVSKRSQSGGGFLITAVPSEYQPAFA